MMVGGYMGMTQSEVVRCDGWSSAHCYGGLVPRAQSIVSSAIVRNCVARSAIVRNCVAQLYEIA